MFESKRLKSIDGGIAQLARAPALQAGGQRFESVYLHHDATKASAKRKRAQERVAKNGIIAQLVRAHA